VARELNITLHVDAAKRRMLDCLGLPPEDLACLTADVAATRWRVVPMVALRLDRARALLQQCGGKYDSCVAFRPSGWCFGRGGARRHGDVTVHEVAYSEHSSFDELRACVHDLAPSRIIPTVNCHRADKVREMLQMLRSK
jgi:DNA cross-link repair 1A protein